MRKTKLTILMLLAVIAPLLAQTSDIPASDVPTSDISTPNMQAPVHADSTAHNHRAAEPTAGEWRPDPLRAVWMGLIIPGYGQIYNRSYWKLPIVYGGLMGCAYAISWTNGRYESYKEAYRDISTDTELSTDPTRSYNAVLPNGYTIASMGGRTTYTRYLQNQQNSARRFRDISIVATVVVYALSLIDAYVDAQLFDFDISEDLSVGITPEVYHDPLLDNRRSTQLNLAIRF